MKKFSVFFLLFSFAIAFGQTNENPISIRELQQKADAGDANSQLVLGTYYARGENSLPQDAAKALELLGAAASQNLAPAQTYLGIIYAEGKLVPRDMARALQWRELGAKNGTPNDKWVLANSYFFGFMLPKNIDKAIYWMELAAAEGEINSIAKLKEIYEKSGDAEKLEAIEKKFANLELEAAKSGNPVSMREVARKFMTGKGGLPRDRVQGIYWFRAAADKGEPEAMEKLAQMYARGKFLPKNPEKAQELFMKLAQIDNSYCFKISKFYSDGESGFPRDEEKSIEWMERGAENADASTKLYLAWRFWIGNEDLKQNTEKAMYWCSKLCQDPNEQSPTATIARKMLRDIAEGKPAPKSLRELQELNISF